MVKPATECLRPSNGCPAGNCPLMSSSKRTVNSSAGLPEAKLFRSFVTKTQRGCRPQPKQDSLCPPCLSSFNTERTEHLRELRVKTFGQRGHRATTETSRNLRASRRRCRLVLQSAPP